MISRTAATQTRRVNIPSYVAQIEPISIVEFDETDTENQFTQATVDKPPKPGANTCLVEDRAFLRSALRLP